MRLPTGTIGTVWFRFGSPFEYFNDKPRTTEALSADGTMGTVGDVGYVDTDGYLYLTDRATFMIIPGGVNIYPQECEDLLITHPKVADAAVFGVPNDDLGRGGQGRRPTHAGSRSRARDGRRIDRVLRAIISHVRKSRARSISRPNFPRLPTGKLYKRILRDKYWGNRKSRIV